jgi:hypothetical protein
VQYKRSLYDPPDSISTQIPHAKLLSPKERVVSSTDLASVCLHPRNLDRQSFYPAFLVAAILLGSHLVIRRWMRDAATDEDSRQQRCANSIFFFFRPPPAPLPAN